MLEQVLLLRTALKLELRLYHQGNNLIATDYAQNMSSVDRGILNSCYESGAPTYARTALSLSHPLTVI